MIKSVGTAVGSTKSKNLIRCYYFGVVFVIFHQRLILIPDPPNDVLCQIDHLEMENPRKKWNVRIRSV